MQKLVQIVRKIVITLLLMPFKKLHADIKEKLESLEITTPTPFQTASIPVIKSGANVFGIAPKDSGKTTAFILTILNKLKCKEEGNVPRAIVLVENNEIATELYETFLTYLKWNSLRVYLGDEKVHIDILKSEIFEGIDVLISTPKVMSKLFLLNGINSSQLKMFCIDDAEFLAKKPSYTQALMTITQSIDKCQFVIFAEKMHPILKRFETSFMERAITVAI